MKETATVVALVIMGLAVAACSGKGKTTAGSASSSANDNAVAEAAFDSVVVDSTVRLDPADKGSAAAHVKISLVFATGSKGEALNNAMLASDALKAANMKKPVYEGLTIKQAVGRFVQSYMETYKKLCTPSYKQNKSVAGNSYDFELTGKVMAGDKYSAVVLDKYEFAGGAHGQSSVVTINVDNSTGRVLTKQDLLNGKDDKKVAELIVQNFCKQYGKKNLQELGDQPGLFFGMTPYVPDNFVIGGDSVTFIYGSDEVAPHALGVVKAKVALKDLGL